MVETRLNGLSRRVDIVFEEDDDPVVVIKVFSCLAAWTSSKKI
jgi:hypothetical protein